MKPYRLEIHPFAELELKETIDWYNLQRENLGNAFLLEVEKMLALIQQNPELFAQIRKDVRKARLKRFPFIIGYSINRDTIEIYSFFHKSRNPLIWQGRTK